jgi:phage terminase small subunit
MSRFKRKKIVNNIPKKTNPNTGNGKNGNGIKTNNGMTRNQKIFADEWLIDRNGTRAYKVAYPNIIDDNRAAVAAYSMLRKAKVDEYINKKLDKLAAKAEINQEWVLERYRRLVDFDIADFLDDEGNLKQLSEIPKNVLFAANGFKNLKTMIKEGKNGNTKITQTLLHDLKFSDKRAVLDSIGKHLGMFEKDNLQRAPRQINVKLVD